MEVRDGAYAYSWPRSAGVVSDDCAGVKRWANSSFVEQPVESVISGRPPRFDVEVDSEARDLVDARGYPP